MVLLALNVVCPRVGTRIPDLVIGGVIAVIVVRGGVSILREVRNVPTGDGS